MARQTELFELFFSEPTNAHWPVAVAEDSEWIDWREPRVWIRHDLERSEAAHAALRLDRDHERLDQDRRRVEVMVHAHHRYVTEEDGEGDLVSFEGLPIEAAHLGDEPQDACVYVTWPVIWSDEGFDDEEARP